ncbi:MAG: transporter permease [Bacillales bacterium]|jgi:uncharacterized protein Veg|nr:transporter permease [Bacillales bacterium]
MAKRLDEIKKDLDQNVGRKLHLKANGGRRKTIERSGRLTETYPSVFIVELDKVHSSIERLSFSYADILTETVELTFFDETTNIV